MQDVTFTVRDEELRLMPERALYWPRTRTLFIADLHLGKAASFRAGGIPLPEGGTAADLTRLSQALDRTQAAKLIILGDLIHARAGRSSQLVAAVTRWRARHRHIKMILVRGNHDRHAGDPPPEWEMSAVDGPTPGPVFVLQHEPSVPEAAGAYALAGHLHPAVSLAGPGQAAFKLSCFWFRDRLAVLPAFTSFSGGARIYPHTGEHVFAITDRAVIEVSGTLT